MFWILAPLVPLAVIAVAVLDDADRSSPAPARRTHARKVKEHLASGRYTVVDGVFEGGKRVDASQEGSER